MRFQPSLVPHITAPAEIQFGEICAVDALNARSEQRKFFLEGMTMYSKHSKQKEKDQFVRMPVLRAKFTRFLDKKIIDNHAYLDIRDLEQYQFACTKRIQQPEGDCRNHRAKKAAEKKLSPYYPS
jgi:hypothetical protein